MEPSDEIKAQLLRFYEALSSGDPARFEPIPSQQAGVLGIGTDPDEWWEGYDTIQRVVQTQIQELAAAGITVVAGEPQAYREGSVGWAADRPTFRLPDGTALPGRVTAVYHQEHGDWKVVQWHASLGVRNEEAIGEDLTT